MLLSQTSVNTSYLPPSWHFQRHNKRSGPVAAGVIWSISLKNVLTSVRLSVLHFITFLVTWQDVALGEQVWVWRAHEAQTERFVFSLRRFVLISKMICLVSSGCLFVSGLVFIWWCSWGINNTSRIMRHCDENYKSKTSRTTDELELLKEEFTQNYGSVIISSPSHWWKVVRSFVFGKIFLELYSRTSLQHSPKHEVDRNRY